MKPDWKDSPSWATHLWRKRDGQWLWAECIVDDDGNHMPCRVQWASAFKEESLEQRPVIPDTGEMILNNPADDRIGKWLSAALNDPAVCEEMKCDIRNWFNDKEWVNYDT